MELDLDRTSEIPVGVQLAWALRARIASGELAAGSRLPGVRELAAAAAVNANTVRSVYARLEADGLIRAEHGRGTFVGEQATIDERLGAVARRALAESQRAGLDPREVAALLFGAPVPPVSAVPDDPAGRRAALRDEITALERELADVRLAKALQDSAPPPERGTGARLLGEDDLRAQRDALAARLAAMRAGEEPPAAAPPAESRVSATRPGAVWRLSPRPA